MSATPRPADHEAFDELAVGWALHALEPEDEALFARHLPGCPRCARTVADTEEVMGALATDLPPAEPSEELRSRLRAAVDRTEQVRRPPVAPPSAPAGPAPTAGRRRGDTGEPPSGTPAPPSGPAAVPAARTGFSSVRERGWMLALAAAVASVVGLGIWNVSLSEARDRAVETAAEQRAAVAELLQPGSEVVAQMSDPDGGTVAAVVVRDGNVQVVSQSLAVNDDTAETYVLWGLREGEAPEAVGTFDVVRSPLDVDAVGSTATGPDGYDQYAVSLEPGRQPPAEPSEVLAIGQVTS
jgi:anti-sigma-K factor RskA